MQLVRPPAGLFDADELREDQLDQAVGGLERAWIPGQADETAARRTTMGVPA
ncbi:MAG TPA: hypothetical protein VFS20_16135 [Longimicrobium sp.]|nr:hypothetical protein [Longimicrobium sp.]